jgi:uncharacterized protein
MKLGILSDTHNQRERCEQAVVLLQAAGVDALIHCGDFTDTEILEQCAVLPCSFVLGNNDFGTSHFLKDTAEEVNANFLGWGGVVTLAKKTIAVTHGHLAGELHRLLAMQPDYLLTGHTHVAEDRREGTTRCINPGALHRSREFTVAVLDLATDRLDWIDVPR